MRSFRTFAAVSAMIAAPLFLAHSAAAETTTLTQALKGAGEVFAEKGAAAVTGKTEVRDADGVVSGLNTVPAASSSRDAAAAVGGYGDKAAREAVLSEIFRTLPVEQIFELGSVKGLMQVESVQQLPTAAQEHLLTLTREEVGLRDAVLTHDLAVSNGQDLTVDQLQEILAVARVPLIQQAMLAGATGDQSHITPPSAADQVVLTRAEKEPFVMAFLQSINLNVAGFDLQAGFQVAAARQAMVN